MKREHSVEGDAVMIDSVTSIEIVLRLQELLQRSLERKPIVEKRNAGGAFPNVTLRANISSSQNSCHKTRTPTHFRVGSSTTLN
jgi:hypothetical protein